MKGRIARMIQSFSSVMLACPLVAVAAMPDGIMTFQLTSDDKIYELGGYSECETVNEPGLFLTLCMSIDMAPDAQGRYTGSASLDFSGDITGTLVGAASGSVKGKINGEGKAKLMFGGTGSLTYDFITLGSEIKVNCKGTISATGFLSSLCKLKLKIEGTNAGTENVALNYQLNGLTWMLTLDVSPVDEKKFAGTGTDSLGYAYSVSGKYRTTSDTSQVKAAGLKDTVGKGAKVQLKELTAGGAATAKLQVQGYKGIAEVQVAP